MLYLQNKYVPMLMSEVLLELANLDGVPWPMAGVHEYDFHMTLISAIIQAYMYCNSSC